MEPRFDPVNRHEDLVKLVKTMNVGIVGRSPSGDIEYINAKLLGWLGYTEEEVLGRPAWILTTPDLRDLVRDEMESAQHGDLRVRLTVLLRKDGTTFPVISVPHRVFFDDDGDDYVGGFGVLVDLGAVQTAKPAGYEPGEGDIRETLSHIAMQLQSLSLAHSLPSSKPLPLDHPELQDLSPRETEVLTLLFSGDRVAAIAQALHISPHTVRNHLKSMYRKLDVQNQSELIQKVRSMQGNDDGGPGEHGDATG